MLQKRESEGFGFVLRGAKGRNRGTGSGVVGVWRKRRRDLKKKKKSSLLCFMTPTQSTESGFLWKQNHTPWTEPSLV